MLVVQSMTWRSLIVDDVSFRGNGVGEGRRRVQGTMGGPPIDSGPPIDNLLVHDQFFVK